MVKHCHFRNSLSGINVNLLRLRLLTSWGLEKGRLIAARENQLNTRERFFESEVVVTNLFKLYDIWGELIELLLIAWTDIDVSLVTIRK